jgi:hypothetical protein
MRTLLFLSSVVLACAAPTPSQEYPTEKESMGLKGPVKSVRVKWYKSVQGEPVPNAPLFEYEVTLDREGRKVGRIHYTPDGMVQLREVYTYDATGTTEVSYRHDGKFRYKLVTQKEEFDKARRTGRIIVTGYDGAFYNEHVKKYDDRGRWVEGLTYDREGKLQSRSVRRLAADGMFQEFLVYNGAGTLLQRHVRGAEGIQVFIYSADGALVSTEMRRWPVCKESDASGNCQSETLTKSVSKGGKVEEVTELILRTFTYY